VVLSFWLSHKYPEGSKNKEETDEQRDEQELWEDRDREFLLLGDSQKSGNVGGIIMWRAA
jgi:hypothetical protein